jgi:dienelactone hydrolase
LHLSSNAVFAGDTDHQQAVRIEIGGDALQADLTIPERRLGLAIFAHGSGSSRHSPRNAWVARQLNEAGIATLLIDLLTRTEEAIDLQTGVYRFNIDLLAQRLNRATEWCDKCAEICHLPVGYFGASTGAAAALVAAAERPREIAAVVSRGGRPDLASDALSLVHSPTLLIVGDLDTEVLSFNERALHQMHCERQLVLVPGASHLFEEPGALRQVADLAQHWFTQHFSHAAPRNQT